FSCSPQERSWEWRTKGRGYFSYFLEEGLRRGAADGQGVVRVRNLVEYLQMAVYGAVQREEGKEQTPYPTIEGPGATELILATGRPPGSGGGTAATVADGSVRALYEAALQRGYESYKERQYEAAEAQFKAALALDGRSAKALTMLGAIAYTARRDHGEA